MPSPSGASLAKFFVFNPTISKKETTEHENVLYYWPPATDQDRQTIDVGLARGLITFTRTFSPDKPIELMQTDKHQQVFHEHEPDFWFVMVCSRPKRETGKKEKEQDVRELEHRILLGVLQRLCRMLKLLQGSLAALLADGVPAVTRALAAHFDVALPLLTATTLSAADVFDAMDGVQYLATDRLSFLNLHGFLSKVELEFPDSVVASMVLVDDYLVYSGLSQNDTRGLYRFLTRRRPRARGERPNPERGDNVLFLSAAHPEDGRGLLAREEAEEGRGRFLTAEEGGGAGRGGVPAPVRVFAGDLPGPLQPLSLVAWQPHQQPRALFVFFLGERAATAVFHQNLDQFAGREVRLNNPIPDPLQRVARPPEPEDYQYVYFNHTNLALKSNLRKPGTLIGSSPNAVSAPDVPELMGHIEGMHADFAQSATLKEVIMKTKRNEQWVVGRRWGHREFYAFFDAKRTLADVTEELRSINKQFFLNSFIDY